MTSLDPSMAAPLMQMARCTLWPGARSGPVHALARCTPILTVAADARGPGTAGRAVWRGAARPAVPLPASPGAPRAWPLQLSVHDPRLHEDLAGRAGPDRIGDQL